MIVTTESFKYLKTDYKFVFIIIVYIVIGRKLCLNLFKWLEKEGEERMPLFKGKY